MTTHTQVAVSILANCWLANMNVVFGCCCLYSCRVLSGALGFSVISQKGDTLLDLDAENEEVRNNWVR